MRKLTVASLMVCVSASALAQTPPVVPDSARSGDSARVAISAMQIRASIVPSAGPAVGSSIPARLSVLERSMVLVVSPRILPDALASQAGVSAYDDLGTPWKLNMTMRGFSVGPTMGLPPGATIFVDGIRQNEPDAQEVNFDLLPLDHVSRIEWLGGNASLLGPNSLGGAVNLVTMRGEGPASGELELSGGSHGGAAVGASVSGRNDGGTDYFAAASYDHEQGWRDETGAHRFEGIANFGRSTATAGVAVQLRGARSRAETAGSLPETLFDTSPRVNFTAGDFEDLNDEQVLVTAYRHAAVQHVGVSVYARRSGGERFNVNQAPDPDVRSRTANATLGTSADWRRAFGLASRGTVATRLGIDAAANRVRTRMFSEPADSTPRMTTDVRSPSVDAAIYALADYQRGRVTLSGGARQDFVRVPFQNRFDASDPGTTSEYHHLSPRGGISIVAAKGVSLYASAGGSFRAPAILELGCADADAACPLPFALGDDPPLRPVRATSYEVGGRWVPDLATPILATVSLFRTDVRDEIFFVASDDALLSGYFMNLDRTRREGLELAIQGSAGSDRLSWYANYAVTRATFQSASAIFSLRSDDDFAGSPLAGRNAVVPGDRIPLVPGNQLKAGVTVRAIRRLSLGVSARRTGTQWFRGDEANETTPLPSYSVADGRVSCEMADWDVNAAVTNLFDSRRAIFGTFNENRQTGELERFLTPMNARSVEIRLTRHWGR